MAGQEAVSEQASAGRVDLPPTCMWFLSSRGMLQPRRNAVFGIPPTVKYVTSPASGCPAAVL